MNSAALAVGFFCTFAVAYFVGFRHGDDTARLEVRRETEVVVAPYPYAATCSAMLEAAWEVQDALPAGSPHKP